MRLVCSTRAWCALAATGFTALTVSTVLAVPAQAQDYFAGKQIRIILPGSTVDTGYGLYGMLASQYLSRFIPGNPTVVISYMPGGAGITALNYLASVAPKDGTAIAVVTQEVATNQARHMAGVRYDASKFKYIVRIAPNVPVHMVWHTAPVKTIADLKTTEVVTAAVGVGGVHNDIARAMNVLLGMKWKVISGYPGTNETRVSMERGETQATVSPAILFKEQLKDWLDQKKVRVIVQYSDFRHPMFPDVPTVVELAQDQEARDILTFMTSITTIGRGFAGPPDMNEKAYGIIRQAFVDMLQDKGYREDSEKRGAEILPMWGEEMSAYVNKIIATPHHIADRATAIAEGR
ncbi:MULTISPECIES: tripartite tricarboxylate transporter substrate-binding protein [unclassified Beijerinckia]|uniref:Bug family tripartite tricarboxylate transporter substrate binding protein n=1 Tax=unclassified Beijerinckia TaxID=2638183 RepID=UPI000898EC7B|nr:MULTISPECIES: tripartite tricarboxylate transporter substrate-binding protein [unclassified Beijerinckia]MDH7797815.1 tripartite-type tricarboxylate transporter receptor subunit TctC [Beijerinckia sp. GAS462]SEC99477.1 Tripartite-type tricarboxylate transporter, receptor component TctC [Beijerinckia sp. 28-YEA-48]